MDSKESVIPSHRLRGTLSIDLSALTNCRYVFALSQDKLFHQHNSVSVADVAILIEILQMLGYSCKQ